MSPPKNKPTKSSQAEPLPTEVWENQVGEAVSKALISLYPRIRVLEAYSDRLSTIDNKVVDFTERAINQTTRAYWITSLLYILKNLVAIVVLGVGLYIILFDQNKDIFIAAIICVLGGIIGLVFFSSQSLLKNTHSLMANIVKLNVIISGHTRQIYQVDTVFKEMFSSGKEIEQQKLEQMLANLQDTIDEAMNSISQVLDEMNE